LPASSEEDLAIHFDGRLSSELSSGQVGIVRRVDVVVRKWLIHVLVDVETVEKDRCVLVGHQVPTETVDRQFI